MLAGDFNGSLGGSHSCDSPNQTGQLLFEAICRCNLYVASQPEGARGENTHMQMALLLTTTFWIATYMAHSVLSYIILPPVSLNFSDHLPIITCLNIKPSIINPPPSPSRLKWYKANEGYNITLFSGEVTR